MSAVRQLGPDVGPRFYAQIAAGHLALGRNFHPAGGSRVHVSMPGEALVEVRLADARKGSKAAAVFNAEFAGHGLQHSESLRRTQELSANRYPMHPYLSHSDLLETQPMETGNERRRRKLADLCKKHSSSAIARQAGVNPFALEQVVKGVLLPEKLDGTRTPRSLGDKAARAIEAAYELGEGWFDAPDDSPRLGGEALAIAASYENMSPIERQRLRLLMLAALDGVDPVIPEVPDKKRHPRGYSMLGGLEDLAPFVPLKKPQKRENK